MVAIEEGEIETSPFREELRQDDLGFFGVELDKVAHAGLLKYREADTLKPRLVVRQSGELVGVGGDVVSVRPVFEQALADEQRRDRKPEAGFERSAGTFVAYPAPKCEPLRFSNRDRE